MRKPTILCVLFCIAVITSYAQNEEDNVKKAIQTKFDVYHNRDLESWKAAWQHNADVSNTVITRDGYFTIKGWDSLEVMMQNDIKQNSTANNMDKVEASNFIIHSDGNLATAEYDVTFTPGSDQSSMFPYTGVLHYHDYEVLVKDNGQWKTQTRIVTLPQSYTAGEHTAETDLNTAGYDLLASKRTNEAIEVFKLNVKLHPNSWNTYDSLGEAYAAAGNKKEAIANYEKSMQLNPKSESGKTALVKLKQK